MQNVQGGFFERTQGSMHQVVVEDYSKRRMGNIGASSSYLLKVMLAHAGLRGGVRLGRAASVAGSKPARRL